MSRNAIGMRLLIVVAAALVACWLMLLSAIDLGPVSPDPSSGHVVPYTNHGTTQYITELQHALLWGLPLGFVAALAVGMWLRKKDERNDG